jgi:hypothetical protein
VDRLLNFVWDQVCPSAAPPELVASGALEDMLRNYWINGHDHLPQFLERCMACLQQHINVFPSLVLIRSIINVYPTQQHVRATCPELRRCPLKAALVRAAQGGARPAPEGLGGTLVTAQQQAAHLHAVLSSATPQARHPAAPRHVTPLAPRTALLRSWTCPPAPPWWPSSLPRASWCQCWCPTCRS